MNLSLLVLSGTLYVVGVGCLVFQGPAEGVFGRAGSSGLVFGGIGFANLFVCAHALRTRRIYGIAFRSRFIARREFEPVLYWSSLAIFAISGAFLASIAVASIGGFL